MTCEPGGYGDSLSHGFLTKSWLALGESVQAIHQLNQIGKLLGPEIPSFISWQLMIGLGKPK